MLVFSAPSTPEVGPTDVRAEPPRRTQHRATHPAARLVGTVLAAYVALAAGSIAVGLLVTDWSATAGLRRWDTSVNRWFVVHGTGTLDGVTAVGSRLADTMTVVVLALVVAAVVWWRRRDLYAVGVIAVGLGLEVAVFLTTTVFVDRPRPPVRHLDGVPPTSSFPSGHTAAAIVLYLGVVIVLRRSFRPGAGTTVLTVTLVLVPVFVAGSRLYRGLHAPSDVLAGAALGALALVVASVAVGRATAAGGRAPARPGSARPESTRPEPARPEMVR